MHKTAIRDCVHCFVHVAATRAEAAADLHEKQVRLAEHRAAGGTVGLTSASLCLDLSPSPCYISHSKYNLLTHNYIIH